MIEVDEYEMYNEWFATLFTTGNTTQFPENVTKAITFNLQQPYLLTNLQTGCHKTIVAHPPALYFRIKRVYVSVTWITQFLFNQTTHFNALGDD